MSCLRRRHGESSPRCGSRAHRSTASLNRFARSARPVAVEPQAPVGGQDTSRLGVPTGGGEPDGHPARTRVRPGPAVSSHPLPTGSAKTTGHPVRTAPGPEGLGAGRPRDDVFGPDAERQIGGRVRADAAGRCPPASGTTTDPSSETKSARRGRRRHPHDPSIRLNRPRQNATNRLPGRSRNSSGGAELLQATVAQHPDAAAQGQGVDRVVGDEDYCGGGRGPVASADRGEIPTGTPGRARERLVQQPHPGRRGRAAWPARPAAVRRRRAGAGSGRRRGARRSRSASSGERGASAPDVAPGYARERHVQVLLDRQVRVQRRPLRQQRHPPPVRRQPVARARRRCGSRPRPGLPARRSSRSSVVFPDPDGPSRASRSPASTARSVGCRPTTPPG